MYSKFWDNARERLRDKKDGQKGLAGISGVGRTAINNGIARKSSPLVDHAYAIAKALDTTIEELIDGELGEQYIRGYVQKKGWEFTPPDRIAGIVEALSKLSDDDLVIVNKAMSGAIEGIRELKKSKEKGNTGTSALVG